MLPLELKLTGTLILVTFIAWVLWLIRRQRLTLRDSLLWLLSTAGALLLTLAPGLLGSIAHAVGVQVASNALFAAAVVYLSVNVLGVTLVTSANSARVVRLAQECALLRGELARLEAALSRRAEQATPDAEDARQGSAQPT